MKHLGTKTLASDRLMLRRFELTDAEAMFKNWAADPKITRYLLWDCHENLSVSQSIARSWVASYEQLSFYLWAIVIGGEAVGTISVVQVDDASETVEIGYCLSRKEWGKGIMTEALFLVMRFLFDEVNVHRVTLKHDTDNPGSGRVMLKNGLRYEGTQKSAVKRRFDGSWGDYALYAMLKDEWENFQRKRLSALPS